MTLIVWKLFHIFLQLCSFSDGPVYLDFVQFRHSSHHKAGLNADKPDFEYPRATWAKSNIFASLYRVSFNVFLCNKSALRWQL